MSILGTGAAVKVPMLEQGAQKLSETLEAAARLDGAVRRTVETHPFLGLPFGLAIPVFLVLLALVSPLVTPARDFTLPVSLSLPRDLKLGALLFHNDALDALLAETDTPASKDGADDDQTIVLQTQTYTLKKGDMLSSVAKQFNLTLGTLISFNNIKNVRRVGNGTTLVIPNTDGVLYTAVTGDSLSGIARTSKIPYEKILEANSLSTPVITPGQKVFLPGATLSTWDLKQASGELFIYPVRGYITSRFGTRRDPFTGVRTFHNGIDLANSLGTPVRASMAGTVTDTGYNSAYGNYIVINHEGGFQTLYGHLKAFNVKVGDYVDQGQLIGQMGSTGYSTGSHTHFSIFKWHKALNPLNYLY
jgi:murein DD-endopeptidase MepM/ murein hydrolase activator NlpD